MTIVLAFGLTGCMTNSATYTTKYVTNIDMLDIREAPDNSASILVTVPKGTPISFEKDAKNGYSKVVYDGMNGYALSAYLTLEAPSDTVALNEGVTLPAPPVQKAEVQNKDVNNNPIISNRSTQEIENYITNYVRPLYSEVNNNLKAYSETSMGGVTEWRDSKGCIRKSFSKGVNGVELQRDYYYDTDSGRIAFAFLYSGDAEYRLYFRTNQLVRYIGTDGETVNNPRDEYALRWGEYVLSEAY